MIIQDDGAAYIACLSLSTIFPFFIQYKFLSLFFSLRSARSFLIPLELNQV